MKYIFTTFCIFGIFLNSYGQIITVSNAPNSPGQYFLLQDAIDAATDGDTLYVHGGGDNYGTITVNKRLTFIGSGYNAQGLFSDQPVISLVIFDSIIPYSIGSGSKLIGLTIGYILQNTNYQIDDITFERCRFYTNTQNHISGNRWTFINNLFQWGNQNGSLTINQFDDVLIANNIFVSPSHNTSYHIRESNKDSVKITNNLFTGGFESSGQFLNVTKAIFTNNIFYGKPPTGATNSKFYNNITFANQVTQIPSGNDTLNNKINKNPLFTNVPPNTFTYSYDHDYRLTTQSPGYNAGTDGTDIGIFGGLYPMPLENNLITGQANIPRLYYYNIKNNTIEQGTMLKVKFSAKHSQNIVYAEYFLNTEPGLGNGNSISLTQQTTDITVDFEIPTASVAYGFNNLFIRLRAADGLWSLYVPSAFYIKPPAPAPMEQLISGEYFINTDPGVGNAAAIPAYIPGDSVTVPFTAQTLGIAPGFNFLFFRAKDLGGIWSLYTSDAVYIVDTPTVSPPINYAEYFFNTDPGVGNGIPINFPDTNDITLDVVINTSTMQPGLHHLFFRFRDTTNTYGLYAGRSVRICDIAALADFVADTVCFGQDSTTFINLSTGGDVNTVYRWDFTGNGVNDLSHTGIIGSPTAPQQFKYKYQSGGTFNVRLITDNGAGCSDTTFKQVVAKVYPPAPTPSGPTSLCINSPNSIYTIPLVPDAASYYWTISPAIAGTITVLSDDSISVDWNNNYHGSVQIRSGVTYNPLYGPCDSTSSAPLSAPLNIAISQSTVGGALTVQNSSICIGSSTGTISLSGHIGSIVRWEKRLDNANWITIQPPVTSSTFNETPSTAGVWNYRVLVKSGACDSAYSSIATINVLPIPTAAGAITGPDQVCQGQQQVTFCVSAISGATNYTWSSYNGASIHSGQGTNCININFSGLAPSGTISVVGSNNCGQSAPSPAFGINVHTAPIVTISPFPDIAIPFNSSTSLSGTVTGGTSPYSYAWSPQTLVTSPNTPNTITTNLQNSTIFILTVTDSIGCKGQNQTNVIITGIPLNPWAFSNPSSVCPGEVSMLSAVPSGGEQPYTYSWSSNPTGFSSTSQNPTVTPTVSTTYTVTVTDNNSQSNTAVTSVIVNPKPSAAGVISGPTSVCQGQVGYTYSVPPINGATSYTWNLPVGATISSGANTNTIVVNFSSSATSGNIEVAGVNTCGTGTFSNQYAITVNAPPIVNAGLDQNITIGTSTVLSGSASGGSLNFTYSWSPASQLDSSNILNPQTLPLSNSTTFILSVTDNVTNCHSTDNMQVVVVGYPLNVATNALPSQICQGESSQISALPGGGSGTYTFEWSSNPGIFTSIEQNPVVTPSITTTYTVTVTGGAQTAVSSIVVAVSPKPDNPGLITGPDKVCKGDVAVDFSISNVPNANAYHWILPTGATILSGTGTNNILVNFSLQNAVSGNIMVYASNFCGISDTSQAISITVHPLPIVDAGNDTNTSGGLHIPLNGTVSGGSGFYTYLWTPVGFVDSPNDVLNTQTTPISQSVLYTLTVTDTVYGCVNSATKQVVVTGGALTVSATASPMIICQGASSQLNALPGGGTGDFSYAWSANPGTFSSSVKNPTVSPTVTTTYTVTVTDNLAIPQTTETASVVITVNPLPDPAGSVFGITSVCQGEMGVLYDVPPINEATGYYWFLPQGVVIASGQNTNAILVNYLMSAVQGDIFVSGTNFCGFGIPSPPYSINIDSLPIVDAGPTQTIAQGGTVTLDGSAYGGSGVFGYSWQPFNFLTNPNISNPTTTAMSTSQLFTLTVTDSVTGCQNASQTQVIVTSPFLSVSASANPSAICVGDSTSLFALPTGGAGAYTYLWTSNIGSFTSNQQSPTVSPTETTQYTVTIDDGSQTASHFVTVTVNPYPTSLGAITGVSSVCKGETGVFYSVDAILGVPTYTWAVPSGAVISAGQGTSSIMVNFTTSAQSGTISVFGMNSCGSGPSSSLSIVANNLPTALPGSNVQVPSGTSHTFNGSATGGSGSYSYLWSPSVLLSTTDTIHNPTTIALTNPATFTLTVTDNQTGCEGSASVQVYIGNPTYLSATATSSPQIICEGQQSQLNAIPTGGTGNYQYAWSSVPVSNFDFNLQNPIVSPTVTTTYYVTVTSDTLSFVASTIVTVSPLPQTGGSITGLSTVCQGTTGVMYAVPQIPGATSYTWILPPDVSIVSGFNSNNITVNFGNNAASGLIKVKGVNICGEGPESPGFYVLVNNSPNVDAGADITIASGATAPLNGSVTPSTGPFTYQWSPNSYFSQNSANSLNPTTMPLTSSVVFTLTVTDTTTGCIGSDQVNVYVTNPGAMVSVSISAPVNTICEGGGVQLSSLPSGGLGNYEYDWTSIPSGFLSNLPNPTVTPTVTTQYIVVVTDDGGGTASNDITIYVNPIPGPADTISGLSTVCQNQNNVQFCVPPIPHATGYMWSLPAGATIASGQSTNCIYVNFEQNAVSGQFTVYAFNNCGLGASSPVLDVHVNPAPIAWTNPPLVIPYDSVADLQGHATGGSGSYTYTWSPATYIQNPNAQNPQTDPLTQSMVFNLYVTDNVSGCQSHAQTQVIVFLGPSFTVLASPNADICEGQSVQLNALPTGGNGLYQYEWSPATGLNNPNISNPVATPSITTEYVVEVISDGQTATHAVIINVTPPPGNVGVISGSNAVCKGETGVLFTIPPVDNATNYFWNLPFGATIVSGHNTNTIMVNFANNATSGNISVYASNICGYSNTSPNFYVILNSLPIAIAGPDQFIPLGTSVNLTGSVGGSNSFSHYWSPGGILADSAQLVTSTIVALNNSHIFTLTVTDSVTGCQGSDYMKVIVCGGPLNVTAFANQTSICEGNSTHLDALPGGGSCTTYVYSWVSNTSSFTSNIANPLVTPSVTTTYTVTVNDGTNTASDQIVLYVQPLVVAAGAIQGPQVLCQNAGTVTYSVDPIYGALAYVWSFPQGVQIVSGADSNVVEVLFTDTALTGFASVYGTNFCGFGVASPQLPITVKPLPGAAGAISGPTYLSKGNNIVQFSIPPIPGTTVYVWELPYGAVILSGHGTNSITVEFTDDAKSGFVSVYGVNSCGTGDASSEHLLTIITSIAELYNLELKIFPNPSKGNLSIEFNVDFDFKFNMKVLSLIGRELYSTQITQKQSHFDFGHLPNGMYFIVFENDEMRLMERFVITK